MDQSTTRKNVLKRITTRPQVLPTMATIELGHTRTHTHTPTQIELYEATKRRRNLFWWTEPTTSHFFHTPGQMKCLGMLSVILIFVISYSGFSFRICFAIFQKAFVRKVCLSDWEKKRVGENAEEDRGLDGGILWHLSEYLPNNPPDF